MNTSSAVTAICFGLLLESMCSPRVFAREVTEYTGHSVYSLMLSNLGEIANKIIGENVKQATAENISALSGKSKTRRAPAILSADSIVNGDGSNVASPTFNGPRKEEIMPSLGTTFGKNPTDAMTIRNLIRSKKSVAPTSAEGDKTLVADPSVRRGKAQKAIGMSRFVKAHL